MLYAVLSGFLLALFAPLVYRFAHHFTGWVIALLPLGLFVYFATFIPLEEPMRVSYQWVPVLDVSFSFYLDGLSLMMALIITGVGTLIMVYAGGYLHDDETLGRFYTLLLIFMAAMLGLVLADNLLSLYIFWELTTVSSFLLIGYKHREEKSRSAAQKALLVTTVGGLSMLAGFILIGITTGTWELSQIVTQGETLRDSANYLPILLLVGLGAFTKSAQVPFHIWLPGAMAAPTPVSAYLHSATMVKAGVYLLARISPALSGTDAWTILVTGIGALTFIIAGYISVIQVDLKRILAYSTVSSLGLMVMLLGYGTDTAVEAAMLFIVVHSLYKGALFMIAGNIDHATGTRDVTQLGGLFGVMPLTAIGTILAALSMAGIVPMIGFVGKELVYEATLAYHSGEALDLTSTNILLSIIAVAGNLFAVTVAAMSFFMPFTGRRHETPHHPHRSPFSMWLGPIVLGLIAVAGGFLIAQVGELLIGPASSAVLNEDISLSLYLIPSSVNPMLILSIITLIAGLGLFLLRGVLYPLLHTLDFGEAIGPERAYEGFIKGLPRLADAVTGVIQSGYLRYYVMAIVSTTVLLGGFTYIRSGVGLPPVPGLEGVLVIELLLAFVLLAGVVLTVTASSMLRAIIALSVVGFGIALLFLAFSAPDLAMTQLAIETLTLILFLLVIYRLPKLTNLSETRSRIRDGVIAGIAGASVTVLMLAVIAEPGPDTLSNYFIQNSYTEAEGHNIVNVILVDFRSLDTLGEITVLSIAATGVFVLLALRMAVNRPLAEEEPGIVQKRQQGESAEAPTDDEPAPSHEAEQQEGTL